MLNPNTPDAHILRRVDLPMLKKAYNDKDVRDGRSTTVVQETPSHFVVDDIFPVGSSYDASSSDLSCIQYGIPKRILFNVPSADQIPQLADFRIRCHELDEVFGFSYTGTTFYYLFGNNARVDLDGPFQKKYTFNLCDPLKAADILVIATMDFFSGSDIVRRWRQNIYPLVTSASKEHAGMRATSYDNKYEFYGITKFHLPYFSSGTDAGTPEHEVFQSETERRIQHLRQVCHEIWTNQLFQLEQKANSLDNYIAALRTRAAEFEAHARSLREEAAQYEAQLEQKNAQPA